MSSAFSKGTPEATIFSQISCNFIPKFDSGFSVSAGFKNVKELVHQKQWKVKEAV